MASATNIRVKVKVSSLLEAVKAQRAAQVRVNEKAQTESLKRFAEWQKKAHAAIDRQLPTEYDNIPSWSRAREESLTDFDRDIKLLEMCTDESLTITSSSSFLRYL